MPPMTAATASASRSVSSGAAALVSTAGCWVFIQNLSAWRIEPGQSRKWQGRKASNPRPTVLETVALPAELLPWRPDALDTQKQWGAAHYMGLFPFRKGGLRENRASSARKTRPDPL